MKILALEFSSDQRGVALAVDGQIRATAVEAAPRVTRAFGLIEEALAGAQVEREQIEVLTIGLGPGSYGGIRAALALAQGWQLARPVKLLGISSMECLAAEARGRGLFGIVNLVIDAQRNELYFARYEISADGCRAVTPLKLAAPDEVRAQSADGEIIAGPGVTQWFSEGRSLFPGADTLAQLAATRSDFVSGDALEPIYLRETSFVKAPSPRVLPP